jgi:hypothetical protein
MGFPVIASQGNPNMPAHIKAHTPVRPLHVETGGAYLGKGQGQRIEVILKGVLYPKGNYARYWFQWGTSTRYGRHTEPTYDEGFKAFGPEGASGLLHNLKPGTTYHYRIVGKNAVGKTYGADRVFRTNRRHPG